MDSEDSEYMLKLKVVLRSSIELNKSGSNNCLGPDQTAFLCVRAKKCWEASVITSQCAWLQYHGSKPDSLSKSPFEIIFEKDGTIAWHRNIIPA